MGISVFVIGCIFAAEFRHWTTSDGRRSNVRLQVVEQSDGQVSLRREDNGRLVELPVERLSEDDRAYLREIAAGASNESVDAPQCNWPRFRGPDGSGVSDATGLPAQWSATRNIVWTTKLPGAGASSPITFGGHIYLTCYSGYGLSADSPGNKSDLTRHLVCLDRTTGEIIWDRTLAAEGHEKPYDDMLRLHGYATNTPAADESGVYVFYGPSGAAAYTHEGELKWTASGGTNSHTWGCSSSVVLCGDLAIYNAQMHGGFLLALDKGTGRVVWRQHDWPGAYHTPLLIDVGDDQELIVQHNQGEVSGLDPTSGERLWQCKVFDDYLNASPIARDGVVYLIGGSGGHAAAVRAGGRGDVTDTHKLWELNKGSYVTSAVYHDGHLYWSRDDGGIVYCADAETGGLRYEKRLDPPCGRIYASPLAADGKLYYVSREHGTYVVDAEPEYRLLAHNTIESDNSIYNASPAVCDGRILIRSDAYLYCIGLRK